MRSDTDIRIRQVGGSWHVYSGGSFVGFATEEDAQEYAAELAG